MSCGAEQIYAKEDRLTLLLSRNSTQFGINTGTDDGTDSSALVNARANANTSANARTIASTNVKANTSANASTDSGFNSGSDSGDHRVSRKHPILEAARQSQSCAPVTDKCGSNKSTHKDILDSGLVQSNGAGV